jgi:hypothetical protein
MYNMKIQYSMAKISRWGEIFRTYPDLLRGPPSLLYNGYRVFPGGKGGRVVMLNIHPLLVPRLRKSWAVPPLTLWVLLGPLRGALYLYLTLQIKRQTLECITYTRILLMLFCIRVLKLKIFTYYTVFENYIRCLDQQRKNLAKEILDVILRVFR